MATTRGRQKEALGVRREVFGPARKVILGQSRGVRKLTR